jgi:SEC-C motif domain protein
MVAERRNPGTGENGGMCPCGSSRPYAQCCGPYHRAEANAPTAEALMRSRYCAYARHDEAYLLRTWHPRTRPRAIGAGPRWVRLEVLATTGGTLFDTEGTVLFAAHYRESGQPGVLRENSRFVRENGEWRYVGPVSVGGSR